MVPEKDQSNFRLLLFLMQFDALSFIKFKGDRTRVCQGEAGNASSSSPNKILHALLKITLRTRPDFHLGLDAPLVIVSSASKAGVTGK